jgi:hypothetical protein
MLEDKRFQHIVSWGYNGDSFVVKVGFPFICFPPHGHSLMQCWLQDVNEFTKTLLPRHFKHSNFASFVRQLNKYDFHKIKNPEGSGENGHNDQVRLVSSIPIAFLAAQLQFQRRPGNSTIQISDMTASTHLNT